MPTKHFIDARGHRICYVTGGKANLKPALLLHGWIASHQLYRKVFAELGELFHYHALDLVGFGDSDKPSPKTVAYDPDFYADSIAAFADAIGLDTPFTLIAQSMGGMAATAFAAQHPERVEKLILIDSAGIALPPPPLGRLLQAPLIGKPLFLALGGTKKALTDFLKNDVYADAATFEPAVLADMLRVIGQPGAKEAAYATMMNMVSPKAMRAFEPTFAKLRVTTRLIWGEQDPLFPPEPCARRMAGAIPGARLHLVKASGHEPPVEQPAAFMQALREALT